MWAFSEEPDESSDPTPSAKPDGFDLFRIRVGLKRNRSNFVQICELSQMASVPSDSYDFNDRGTGGTGRGIENRAVGMGKLFDSGIFLGYRN